jgi:hypothetical protein
MCRELWSRKRLLLLGLVLSLGAAMFSLYRVVGLLPPKVAPRSLLYAGAFAEVYIDAPHSFMSDQSVNILPYVQRATVFANILATPGAIDSIGRYSGIPGDQIYAAGPLDPSLQRVVQEPTAIKRNIQITGEKTPYQLQFLADPNLPTIGIYTQAPTVAQADALADGAVRTLTAYVASLQDRQHVLSGNRIIVRQIGPSAGAIIDSGIKKKLAGMVFVAAFFAWCVLVLIGLRFGASWRRASLALQTGASWSTGLPWRKRATAPSSVPQDELSELRLDDIDRTSKTGSAHDPSREREPATW